MTGATDATDTAGGDAGPAAGVRWDLTHLYAGPDDPRIEGDLDSALETARRFGELYRDRVAELSAQELAEALDDLEKLSERAARAQAYAGLLFAEDTANPRHGALLQRVQERGSEIKSELVFFELEWLALDPDAATRRLEHPALASRRHLLETWRRYREHVLSEPEERLLEETANTGPRAFLRLFEETMGSLRFHFEHEGESSDLGEEEILAKLHDPRREVREKGASALTQGLRENARVLAFIFNTIVQDKALKDRLRRYPNPKEERNLANEIEGETVEALLGACERHFDLVARYYRTKARLLGIERLMDYDRYAPVLSVDGMRGFEEARRVVLAAYRDFAPPAAEIAERFFAERWIDAELRPGKRGGAFCSSTVPSAHPYVMLSYTGNPRDVMTLAHELGHGIHQYLARERGLFEQDTPLTTAEMASVFGEMLVFRRLLTEETEPRARLALLCGKLEDAFATVFRQVAMTRFEERLHDARRQEGELQVDRINELWLEANRPMFGDSLELSDDYGWWWLYIPHFLHAPFYCYAYAFGELLVLSLLRRYDEEGEAFVPRYLELLAAGGSGAPAALLDRVGADVNDPRFWDGGLRVLEELLGEAEALAERHAP